MSCKLAYPSCRFLISGAASGKLQYMNPVAFLGEHMNIRQIFCCIV